MSDLPRALETLVASRYAELIDRCRQAGVALHDDSGVGKRIRRVLLASDFAFEVWQRQPELLGAQGLERLGGSADAATRARGMLPAAANDAEVMRLLRRFRHAESLRLVFRDINDLDALAGIVTDTTVLYETLLEAALSRAEATVATRFGQVHDSGGALQRLVVLGFGKLGGGELNFSSDIDLVLAYPESGTSDGRRELDAGEYFTRLVRRLVSMLAEHTDHGVVARVDLRLRPFGTVGRLALPFAAMEQYYQREGRDWERYAWIKARPVAGDIAAGRQLLNLLRPFVYRRYFDYTAFAGLRDMKARIDAEVARKDLAGNIKLGPGGIREIEFVVQLVQLIRGGREPGLRARGLFSALAVAEARGFLSSTPARRLRNAYMFLRRLENRLQMLRDTQTHDVPDDPLARERVALGMGYHDWDALAAELADHRAAVHEEFNAVLMPHGGPDAPVPGPGVALWRAAEDGSLTAAELAGAGFDATETLCAALCGLPASPQVSTMSARGRKRLRRLMPHLLAQAGASAAPTACLGRLLRLVQAVARRSAYLALLEEQPAARKRLVELFAGSAFLAERVIAQPLLLDDVLGPRMDQLPLRRAAIAEEIAHALTALEERDAGTDLERLNELKASLAFRLGLAFVDGRADAAATTRRLAALAEAVIGAVMTLAEGEMQARHGTLPGEGSGFAVLGYGSLGGGELGFASDLDLVFIYDSARATARSDGARPLDGVAWYGRLAQRIMHWLSVITRAGSLYEVDTRLRPDGSKGLPVSSLDAFAAYQRERAWVWEHQALVRARPVAGDARVAAAFADIRSQVLMRVREAALVHDEVSRMRQRWRRERDRSDATHLDLKQGAGALVDLEFMLQGEVLMHAADHPRLLEERSTAGLIAACAEAGVLGRQQAQALAEVHGVLLATALSCKLDARQRIAPRDARLAACTEAVLAVINALGYRFGDDMA